MKRTLLTLTILLVGMGSLLSQTPEEVEAMKIWQESMTPNDHHAWLSKMAGKWVYTQKTYANTEGEPMVSQGKSTKTMLLGGRFLQEIATGVNFGMPFEGHGTIGYDNINQKYSFHWMDVFGTAFMPGEGSREGNDLTIHTTYPNHDGGVLKYRMVYTYVNDNQHTMVMYQIFEDGEKKQMEFVFDRI